MNNYEKYNANNRKEEFLKVFMSELKLQEKELNEKIQIK